MIISTPRGSIEGISGVLGRFQPFFSRFEPNFSRKSTYVYIAHLEMSGYSNRGKVMKKTVRVPILSRGPVLQSRVNLPDSSGNLPRYGQNGDENDGHMAVPM